MICLYCNRELKSDNKLYHENSFHAGQVLKFKDVYEKSQKQLCFASQKQWQVRNPILNSKPLC